MLLVMIVLLLYRMIIELNLIPVHIDMLSSTLTKFMYELKYVFQILYFLLIPQSVWTFVCDGFYTKSFI